MLLLSRQAQRRKRTDGSFRPALWRPADLGIPLFRPDRHPGASAVLTRPENIVHFFRDVHGVGAITKEVLRQRITEYNRWVEAFARNHRIPIEWAEKGARKEDYVRPSLRRMERQGRYGVYFILKSMEIGTSFRSTTPKYPTADPDYRILSRQRSRYAHYYFYIRDPVLGPIPLCVGSFLPFSIH